MPPPVVSPESSRTLRVVIVLLGCLLPQAVLFAPSLLGQKLLLPLDVLTQDRYYYSPETTPQGLRAVDLDVNDPVVDFEHRRRFAARELRAGRLPLWRPEIFAGKPFARFGKYSPFFLIYVLFPSAYSLVWIQLLKALVAGCGAYLFLRRALAVSFWPAAVAAWCWPLSGSCLLWLQFPNSSIYPFFPWMLLACQQAVLRLRSWGVPLLALTTTFCLVSGAPDVAGQAMLAAGLCGLWWLVPGRRRAGLAALTLGFGLGILLAAAYLLPLYAYQQTSRRAQLRAEGLEERAPVGIAALPQVVFPAIYGSNRYDAVRTLGASGQLDADFVRIESSAGAYVGLLATLFLAPLAWCLPGRRRTCLLWTGLALLGLSYSLNLPGFVQLWRLPGLNMMSHNRLVFVSAWALLCLAALGLEQLRRGALRRRVYMLGLAALLAVAACALSVRAFDQPEPLASTMHQTIAEEGAFRYVSSSAQADAIRQSFQRSQLWMAGLALLGCGLWLFVWRSATVQAPQPAVPPPGKPKTGRKQGKKRAAAPHATAPPPRVPRWLFPLVAGLCLLELLVFGWGLNAQADPAHDFPPIAVLERLRERADGRVTGVHCLPANLLATHSLRDVCGYDGLDPADLVELLEPLCDPRAPQNEQARLQWFFPRLGLDPATGLRLGGVLDMLQLRYLVFIGEVGGIAPIMQQQGYTVVENPRAMPRAWVVEHVAVAGSHQELLERLWEAEFQPAQQAWLEQPTGLDGPAKGTARVRAEHAGWLELELEMQTPGLVVISERWDAGWQASVDGAPAAVIRVNGVLQGVEVGVGARTLQLRYTPSGFLTGSLLTGFAALALAVFGLWVWREDPTAAPPSPATPCSS